MGMNRKIERNQKKVNREKQPADWNDILLASNDLKNFAVNMSILKDGYDTVVASTDPTMLESDKKKASQVSATLGKEIDDINNIISKITDKVNSLDGRTLVNSDEEGQLYIEYLLSLERIARSAGSVYELILKSSYNNVTKESK